jgi:hypothetical protein
MSTIPAPWKPSEIIRNLRTGRAYMVLQVVRGYATLIAPLDQTEFPPTQTLFTRDYYKFVRDTDAIEKDGKWQADIINL